MIDLNDLLEAVNRGQVVRDQVRVVARNGKIVDFLTTEDQPRGHEDIRVMSLIDVLQSVFDIK